MAGWTHNIKVNTHGYTLFQMKTRKSVTFPEVLTENIVTKSYYNDEGERRMIDCHSYINRMY